MSVPRFFTDEDIDAAVAPALRKAGLDAVRTPEADRLGETDESQLAWADDMEAHRELSEYMHYYNVERRHSSLGYVSPAAFEAK